MAAKSHGLAVKGHVEQLTNSHGRGNWSRRHGGWSADHLEYLDDAGIAAVANAGTVARCCLPGAFYFLREKQKPPVEKLRGGRADGGGERPEPGTSPFASLRLAMNMACVLYGFLRKKALAGITREARESTRAE